MSQATNYFSPDYFTAQTCFRQAVEKIGGRLHAIPIDAKGPGGEELSIDIGWFGAENPKKVLLHSSGLHGVEGFAGSAIQLKLIENLPKLPADTAVIFVHILNPFGMAWLRRVNENNVDLNHNFLEEDEFTGAPPAYRMLDSFLNPQRPPSSDFFHLKAMLLIARYGFPTLKQAIAGGQYEYPKGLFFGGKESQQGPQKYKEFIEQRISSAEQIYAIDVHTGLGKFGEDILLVMPEDCTLFRGMFGDRVVSLEPEHGEAWAARGASHIMIPTLLPLTRVFFLAQEFGTVEQVNVLHAMREENRWHHYGAGTLDHPTKRKLKEIFGPKDESWQRRVLERGQELFNQASELLFSETVRPDVSNEVSSGPLLAVRLTLKGWVEKTASGDKRLWNDRKGGVLTLTVLDTPLLELPPLSNEVALRQWGRTTAEGRAGGLIEIRAIAGTLGAGIALIYKRLEHPAYHFTGMLIIPRRDASLIFTITAAERGTTGLREATITSELLYTGELTLQDYNRSWAQDPYDASYRGVDQSVLRFLSDDERYDSRFPEHPLTKVRRVLTALPSAATVKSQDSGT